MTDQLPAPTGAPVDTARLRAALDAAAGWYRAGLLADRPAAVVELLRDRGLGVPVVDTPAGLRWRVGYPPTARAGPDWSGTCGGGGSPRRKWSRPAWLLFPSRTAGLVGRSAGGGGMGPSTTLKAAQPPAVLSSHSPRMWP